VSTLHRIKRVLFSGGGVRGIAFAGALSVLWNEHQIDWGQRCPPLEAVSGCSIGALYAFFISLGYNCNEIEDIARTCKPDKFVNLDFTRLFSGHLSLDTGECAKQLLVDWLMKKVPELQSRDEALRYTLAQLKEKKKIQLNMYVTHIDSRSLESADESNSVISACLASMALPPLYPYVELKSSHQVPQYADGGLTNFYPMLYEQPDTLGFRLIQKPFTIQNVEKTTQPFLSYLSLALDIAISGKEEFQWSQLTEEQRKLTVTIVCGTQLGSMDLALTDKDHGKVFAAGQQAMKDWALRVGVS
jgi:NTE family protein